VARRSGRWDLQVHGLEGAEGPLDPAEALVSGDDCALRGGTVRIADPSGGFAVEAR